MVTVTTEEWKDIPGFEGMYQASSLGRIRSLDRYVGHNYGGKKMLTGRVMRLSTLLGGYKIVNLRDGEKTHRSRVARLVLSAFVGLPAKNMAACHADNTPSNNRIDNLRWDTYAGNEGDKVLAGTSNRGERNWCSVLTESQVIFVREQLAHGAVGRALADVLGVSQSTITAIKKRRSWAHLP